MLAVELSPIPPRRWAVLSIILTSYLMIVLDVSIVITGLPRIQQSLGFSDAGLSWVHSAYTLAFGGLLLLGARAGDILGRRRMFVAGLGIFTAASLGIGVAPSAGWLLAFRAVQGAGAAVLAPTTLALLSTAFAEGPERTRAVALYGAVAGIGSSIGLVLGGVLADGLSWRAGFFINLPIGVILMLAARRCLSETERHTGRFDLAGAVLSSVAMTALVFGIVRSSHAGWGDGVVLAALGGGVALSVVFVALQARAEQPVMPLHLFASRERSGAYGARMLFLGAMVGFFFFTTQFLQRVEGFTPLQAGMAFLPMTLVNFAVAVMVPRLTGRFGNGRLMAGGLAVTLAGMAWLAGLSADTPYLTGIALPMVLIGIGQGCTLSPLTTAGIAGVAVRDAGAASGVVNAAHQLGGALGLSVLVAVFAAAGGYGTREGLAHQVAASLTAATVLLVMALGVVLALVLPRPQRKAADA